MRANSEALFVNQPLARGPAGKLADEEPGKAGKNVLVKNIIIYKYDDPDFIQVNIPENNRFCLQMRENTGYFIF